MARKDDILKSFLTHELIENKYKLKKEEMPSTVREALNSDIPIVKAVALIVEGLEKSPTATDNELRNSVLQFLNTAI
ncbi:MULTISPECIES: hypothetical protein [Aequorivita]|uniref:Uncharacterized protein n=1 Tax=Aequorivita iocasae TaxID=2803865 RepID=A0ABX7DQ88_9FLAO|nr:MULTISPECIES: hypothetical protein [Aequorivita]QQX76000.1 hypothetical protein JK629_11730 [Aequorivita iocasae]UCA55461.1 hypothetical protein LDL78_11785 [Aequorivita sp. F7]